MRIIAVEGGQALLAASRAEVGPSAAEVIVRDGATAASAVQAALAGRPLLIHALAERATLDRLYDDLRRLGTVEIRTGTDSGLTGEETALLRLLASGWTLRDAAAEMHLSVRTADRRLAAARVKLGAATTAQAVARIARSRPDQPRG